MGSISITFSGTSWQEVVGLVATWSPPESTKGAGGRAAPAPLTEPGSDASAIRRVLAGVHGEKSLRLLRYIAEAGRRGEDVTLTPALVEEFGVSGGTAFAGMIGPVNRRASRVLGRLLIDYPSADPKARVWRVTPDDAEVVLDVLGS